MSEPKQPRREGPETPSTPLRAFGIDRVEPAAGESRVLLCPVSKGWIARNPATRTSAEHPGTAVRWEEKIFEVVETSPTFDGHVRYRLEPWDPRHTIRVIEAYDAPAEDVRGAQRKARRGADARRRLSILLSPILGHLPGPVQEKMEGDFGAPARAMTIASALPLFVVGTLGLLVKQARGFGASLSLPAWAAPPFALALYWFLESALRLFVAFLQGHPMGSLLGVLLYEVFGKWTRRGKPSPAAPAPAAAASWAVGDTYKMLEPLLVLLSPDEQEVLERRFGLAVLKRGRTSAFVVGAVAALNVVISLGMFAQGRDTFWDFAWLVVGSYFFVEQIPRLLRISGGHPAGSLLGALVRPLARRLLAAPPAQ